MNIFFLVIFFLDNIFHIFKANMPDSFHQYFHNLFHTENVSLIKYYMIKNDSELYILPGNSNVKPILINYTEPPLAKNCFDTKAVWLTNNETESLLTYSAQNLTNTFNDQVFSTYLKQHQQIILISLFFIGFLFGLLVFYGLKKCCHNSKHKKTKTCQLPTCSKFYFF